MRIQTYLAALTLSAAPAVYAQDVGPALEAGSTTSLFGQPLVVNGQRVPDIELQRFLIYGAGRLQVEMQRVALIIEDELARRAQEYALRDIDAQYASRLDAAAEAAVAAKEKATPFASADERQAAVRTEREAAKAALYQTEEVIAAYKKLLDQQQSLVREQVAISEDEFNHEYQKTIDDFVKSYPTLNPEAEVARAFRTVDWYRENLRQTLLFDRVFFPDDPAEWPVTTVEAVRADSGDAMIEDAFQSYKMRREYAEKTGEPLAKEDPIYTQMMRQIVRDACFSTVSYKTSFDGLSSDLILTGDKNGDGLPELVVKTADVWPKVAATLSETDILEAKEWFVSTIAVRDALRTAGDGVLLSRDGEQAAIAALKKTMEGTYFTVDILATQEYLFPSAESFQEYWCLMESFKVLKQDALKRQENGDIAKVLRDHLERANRVMGLGQVDVDVMLISAFDIPNFKWKDGGWTWAEKRATEVKAQIEAQQQRYAADPSKEKDPAQFWDELVVEVSEYWDPPSPEGQGKRGSDVSMKNKGRFGPRYRNDLIGFVGETRYREFVTGFSITDFVFFDQAENTVAGPFKGPLGYYLTRVKRRTPPSRPLNLAEPKHVELLTDDWLRVAFGAYMREAVKGAKVQGL
jgi:hypothetical protein